MDLKDMTLEAAQPLLNTKFQVTLEDGRTVQMTLIDAAPFDMPKRPARGSRIPKRPPFALYFLGPAEPVLPQQTYDLQGDTELLTVFIVPVGRDEEGTEYEAVFA